VRGGNAASVPLALCVLILAGAALLPQTSAAATGKHAPRAPGGPPLVSGSSAYAAPSQAHSQGSEESEPESAAAGEDPLVRNGLGSPLCRMPAGEISSAAAAECRTSGFVGSSAPSQDYSFDVNIDTPLGVNVDTVLQDYVVRPIWIFLTWLVRLVLVALEWAYSLELLNGPVAGELAPALRAAQAQFTQPWLASVLACAAVLAAYQGIVRRRVAQTLGEALALLAMIAGTMFVIADPTGTIGALSRWAQQASVGSFAAIGTGSPARPYRSLAASMQVLFHASIDGPWCFLEFGNVSWCDQPARLDPRLRKAAVRIAAELEAQAHGKGADGVGARDLMRRVDLLRQAHTNGEMFLALPPNGPLRNSVKESTSLFYALCGGGSDATSCRGPTAAEAEFRSPSGTLPRLAGVLVIAIGLAGMLLLVGFVVVRLLEAALMSMLFLLLAPAAALAPALGESGRRVFRSWAARLLAAATGKLLWSVLLGALLASMRILLSLSALGWFVQWFLAGALWWGIFMQRHALLSGAASHHWLQGARQSGPARSAQEQVARHARKGFKKAGESVVKRALPKSLGDRKKRREEQEGVSATGPGVTERAAKGAADRLEAAGERRRAGGADESRRTGSAGESRRHGLEQYDPAQARQPSPRRRDTDGEPSGQTRKELEERLHRLGAAHAQAVADGQMRRARSLRMRRQRVRERLDGGTVHSASDTPAAAGQSAGRQPRKPGRPLDRGSLAGVGHRSADVRPGSAQARAAASGAGAGAGLGGGSSAASADAQPSRPRSATGGARAQRADLDRDVAQRKEERDPVMADAIEVARRRRRQLGWSWREEK
jgi:hypothetical protein